MNAPKVSRKLSPMMLIVALIVIVGLGVSAYWSTNKPRAHRTPPKVLAPLVATAELNATAYDVELTALGTVTAAQSVNLTAEVSGEIIEVNPRLAPGAHFAKGSLIARIDPADYKIALRQKEAELVKARYELAVEEGKQAVARDEYALLGEEIDDASRSLVLREPHLKAAQAAVDAAEAAVELAQLNLERTRIVAPFNAIVQERSVALGMQILTGTAVATLVDSDRYWIEASLPVSQLFRVRFGDTPSTVRVLPRSPGQTFPAGKVIGILSNVAEQGRMARVLIEIPNPVAGSVGAPLLLGDIVSVKIAGTPLPAAVRIPRSAVRNGSTLWLLTPDGTLKIIAAAPLWDTEAAIFVAPDLIPAGHRLITSDLAGPVEGMRLRDAGAR